MKPQTATGKLRIIGGKWRSRVLDFPAADQLRPTADRIRETLFNWLREDVQDEDCLDLFAGSGACGLEALSRGARRVTFVERNPKVIDAISANLNKLGEPGMPVIRSDVMHWLKPGIHEAGDKFGIVFVDPPYDERLERECCHALQESGLLKDQALVYLESDRDLPVNLFPTGWRRIKKKRAGVVFFMLFEITGENNGESASS